jgi:hypothetical protein
MDPADGLLLVLPADYAEGSINRLLDRVFPEDEQQRSDIEFMLDVRANPDLPDIYAVFVDAVEGWRKGLWDLSVSTDGPTDSAGRLDLTEPVYLHLQRSYRNQERPGNPSCPTLHLRVSQQYSALEYAVREGFWPSKKELLEWLREMTILYFVDKFEYVLPVIPPSGQMPTPGVAGLQTKGLIGPSEETGPDEPGPLVITEDGRGLIGRLLSETEAYIDLYDHFKDADFDDEAEEVCFGRGRGVDLRAQVYKTEGLDPVRTVFLLRLYDGSLDTFAGEWTGLIGDESFFDEVLEPVINGYYVDDALIGRIVESGYSYLDERREQARRLAAERRIIRRVRDNSPSDLDY